MIFWVAVMPERVGVFNDVSYFIDSFETQKEYLKPFRNMHEAYKFIISKLSWIQVYSLGIDQMQGVVINHWYEIGIK